MKTQKRINELKIGDQIKYSDGPFGTLTAEVISGRIQKPAGYNPKTGYHRKSEAVIEMRVLKSNGDFHKVGEVKKFFFETRNNKYRKVTILK